MNEREKKRWLMIHQVLHDPTKKGVMFSGTRHYVRVAGNGCRALDYDGKTFMVQNINKNSVWARRARNGEKITWVIRKGHWGRIVGSQIEVE